MSAYAARYSTTQNGFSSESGLPFEAVYGPDALEGFDPATPLGEPGELPLTRGVYPTM